MKWVKDLGNILAHLIDTHRKRLCLNRARNNLCELSFYGGCPIPRSLLPHAAGSLPVYPGTQNLYFLLKALPGAEVRSSSTLKRWRESSDLST